MSTLFQISKRTILRIELHLYVAIRVKEKRISKGMANHQHPDSGMHQFSAS